MNLFVSRRYAFALAATVLSILALSACTTGGSKPPAGDTDNNTVASMTTRVNTYRTDSGGDALSTDTTLSDIAQAQADYNAANSINSDTNGSGDTIAEQMTNAGYAFSTVAYLFNNLGESASFNEWKNNGAYSSIMLDPSFTDVGIGTAKPATGQRRWVIIFAAKDVPTNSTVQEMLDIINDYRTAGGAAEVTIDDNLALVAQAQANNNASVQANEAATGGLGLEDQVATTGYSYGLFMWTLSSGGAADSFGRWTDTPDEVTRMRDARFAHVGIGVAVGGTKQWWVVVFAEPITP